MSLGKQAIMLGVGLIDYVSKDLDQMANRLRARSRQFSSIGSELTQGISLPLVAAGAATLKFAGDLDALKKALEAQMGSAHAAQKEFLLLKKAAEAPGMGLEEAIKGSFVLQGLGASADNARHMLTGLAKAVELSGGGKHEFGGLTTQFTQMIANGKILEQDVKFMKENAPVIAGVMNKLFGGARAEDLRKLPMGEVVGKLVDELNRMKGTGGSVKNTLENLWTSLRVGVGEIGLAILGSTNLGEGLVKLQTKMEAAIAKIVDWIKNNRELVGSLLKWYGIIVVTGPIIRLVGNLGLLVSTGMKVVTVVTKMAKAMWAFNSASGVAGAGAASTGKALAGMKAGIAGMVLLGLSEAGAFFKGSDEEQVSAREKEFEKIRQGGWEEAKGRYNLGVTALGALGGLQFGQAWQNVKGMFGSGESQLAPPPTPFGGTGNRMAAVAYAQSQAPKSQTWEEYLAGLGRSGDDEDKDKKENKGPFFDQMIEHKGGWMKGFSTPEDNELDPMIEENDKMNREAESAFLQTKFGDPKHWDVMQQALSSYQEAVKRAGIETELGGDQMEILEDQIGAARSAYIELAMKYGEGDEETKKMKSNLEALGETYKWLTDLKKKDAEQQEKINKQTQTAMTLMDGLSGGVSALVSDGEKGMEGFAKSILKAAAAMFKLAITTYITDTIEKLGFAAAIPAIVGGGLLVGAMDGLINKISLAGGGVITGETMIRAGEYAGVGANPELIAPADKMMKYIRTAVSEAGGGGMVQGVIRGRDIHLVSYMANQNNSRMGTIKF